MRFEKFLKEDASQLAIPGMAMRTPSTWSSGNDPSTVAGKKCPPDKVWNEATQKCEKALASKEVRPTAAGTNPASTRMGRRL